MKARTLTLSLQFTVSWPKAFCVPCKLLFVLVVTVDWSRHSARATKWLMHCPTSWYENSITCALKGKCNSVFFCSCFSPTLGRLCFWSFVTCTRKEAAVQITFTFALSLCLTVHYKPMHHQARQWEDAPPISNATLFLFVAASMHSGILAQATLSSTD